MKSIFVKAVATLIAIIGLTVSAFAQGMYWQTKTEGTVGERGTDNYAMPKKFKMVRAGDNTEGSVVIARLDKEAFWMLNPEKKTYSEMTFADMEKMMTKAGGKMDAKMAEMQEQLKNMPKEQREMVEKMMGGKMSAGAADTPEKIRKTSDTKTISGYNCTKYVATRGDEEVMTMWVTRGVRGFEPLMEDWKEFAKRMSSLTSRFAKGISEAYKTIDGFPIQTTMKIMNNEVTTTVTKMEQRSTPASEFEIPSGYKKVKSQLEDAMKEMEKE
jgi:GLPGLI family protein